MFSTNLKRSVATLGIVAGLLAAAVPASAGTQRVLDGNDGDDALFVKSPTQPAVLINGTGFDPGTAIRGDAQDAQASRAGILENTMVSGYNVKAPGVVVLIGANDYGFADRATPADAPRATEELFGNYNFAVDATGTQVGSEGITPAHEPLKR